MIRNVLARFRADRRGNFVITFALMLVPMLGLMGLGIDYSLTLRTKTALDAATDAAVLAAATEAMQVIEYYSNPNYDATAQAIAAAKLRGQNVFAADAGRVNTVSTPTLTLDVSRSGLVITAKGSYSTQTPTTFGALFGTSTFTAGGHAVSSLTLPKYMNIYIAFDISQSMGIASTQTDMNNLVAYIKHYYSSHGRTPKMDPGSSTTSTQADGCVFGCHVPAPWQNAGDASVESMAHNPIDGYPFVSLRIDAVKQSITNIISSAQSTGGASPTISIGLYSLQESIPADGAQYYTKLSSPTTAYTTLTKAASAIDLGPNDSGGTGDTDFAASLGNFAAKEVSVGGDGSSVNSPQTFVFIITDGVSDTKGGCKDGHCTQAFDPSLCKTFKTKNATVGVIYTTYIPFPSEQTYVDLVQPFASQIAPNLQSCASPGYYYEATDGPAIQAAANALFAQATSAGKLTQ